MIVSIFVFLSLMITVQYILWQTVASAVDIAVSWKSVILCLNILGFFFFFQKTVYLNWWKCLKYYDAFCSNFAVIFQYPRWFSYFFTENKSWQLVKVPLQSIWAFYSSSENASLPLSHVLLLVVESIPSANLCVLKETDKKTCLLGASLLFRNLLALSLFHLLWLFVCLKLYMN